MTEPDFAIPIGNQAVCPEPGCGLCWHRADWSPLGPGREACPPCRGDVDCYSGALTGHLTDWITAGMRAACLGVLPCGCVSGTAEQLYGPPHGQEWTRHLCDSCRERATKASPVTLADVVAGRRELPGSKRSGDISPEMRQRLDSLRWPPGVTPIGWTFQLECGQPQVEIRYMNPASRPRVVTILGIGSTPDEAAREAIRYVEQRSGCPLAPPEPDAASVLDPRPCAGSPGGDPGPQNPDMGETGLPAGQYSEQGRREFGAPRDWYIDGLLDNIERHITSRGLMAVDMVPLTGPPHPPVAEASAPAGVEPDQSEPLDWARSLAAMTESPKPPVRVTTMSTAKPSAALTRRRHIDEARRVLDSRSSMVSSLVRDGDGYLAPFEAEARVRRAADAAYCIGYGVRTWLMGAETESDKR